MLLARWLTRVGHAAWFGSKPTARRFTDGQWRAVETGIGAVQVAMLALLPAERAATL
ncbi:MAG: hypothetical protein JO287_08140 [Pseudonocardiales bacterium]|nr:hypothetical protein [Pseudonocardiales bacterium]